MVTTWPQAWWAGTHQPNISGEAQRVIPAVLPVIQLRFDGPEVHGLVHPLLVAGEGIEVDRLMKHLRQLVLHQLEMGGHDVRAWQGCDVVVGRRIDV